MNGCSIYSTDDLKERKVYQGMSILVDTTNGLSQDLRGMATRPDKDSGSSRYAQRSTSCYKLRNIYNDRLKTG